MNQLFGLQHRRSENESAFSLYFTPFTVSQFHSFIFKGVPPFHSLFYIYLFIYINKY